MAGVNKRKFKDRFTGGIKRFYESSLEEVKRSKAAFIVYLVLALSVVGILVWSLISHNYENSASCVLVLLLFLVPSFLEKKLKVKLPMTFEIIILLFIYAAQILGEMNSFYIRFPWWDNMLHTINGFLFAAVGFALCDVLNQNPNLKFKLSPLFLSVVAFCFSMTIGVMWEFFEAFMDRFFLLDMQKDTLVSQFASVYFDATGQNIAVKVVNIGKTVIYDPNGNVLQVMNGGYLDIGIRDTMDDLLVNLLGAIVFSIFGYAYVKSRGHNHLASQFIPTLDEEAIEAEKKEKEGSLKEKGEESEIPAK